jgi:prepilin-type N-terminal cleavage/methylation domain-containing protein
MKHNNSQSGFTLVELLVALAVFMVIMTISLGSVLSIVDAGRKARSLRAVMTNLNFTFEAMSRDIKFGDVYHCGVTTLPTWTPQNCTGTGLPPANGLTFRTSDGTPTIYRLNGTQIEKSTDNGSSYIGITSSEIVVQDLKFYVFGAAAGDGAQPRVLVQVRGYAGTKPTAQSRFFLQTILSQRDLDS